MNRTTIEWTDYTWNPVTGCHKVSPGCKNCYAETLTNRFAKTWGVESFRDVVLHEDRLSEPQKNKKKWAGKKVFVCSMSDLFQEEVPFNFISKVILEATNLNDNGTIFQILTKRPDRALAWFKHHSEIVHKYIPDFPVRFPFNIWIGTSCENQETANERIPHLLQIPAAVRFLSCEPLLGPITLPTSALEGAHASKSPLEGGKGGVNWVIAGGESGHNARPMHPQWVRSLRDQCASAHVPFFFKQWGEYMPVEDDAQPPFLNFADGRFIDGHHVNILDPETGEAGKFEGHRFYDPMDAITYCMEHKASNCNWWKCGKSKSGNLLDGKQHVEFPKSHQL